MSDGINDSHRDAQMNAGKKPRWEDVKPYSVDEKKIEDPVNHPSHYTFGRFEVIDVLEDWFPEDPLLWQTVKYLARAKHKGNFLQDIKKAQFYLNRRIESEEK